MKKLLSLLCLMFVLTLGTHSSFAGIDAPTNCYPPTGSVFIGQLFATYQNGGNIYDLFQIQHSMFSSCNPPPPPGGTTIHSYGSQIDVKMSVNGGPPMDVVAPAQVTMIIMDVGPAAGGGRTYQTEMLQLNIQGGNLLPGVMIRESPTLQSTGQTTIVPGGPGFHT